MYIDTHAHIIKTFYKDADLDNIVKKVRENNISKVVNISTSIEEIEEVKEVQKKYPDLFLSAYGLHPEIAEKKTLDELNTDLKILEESINDSIIAVGEFGLDYNDSTTKETKEKQFHLAESQLNLAEKLNLPIIIHTRNSMEDIYSILKKYSNLNGVIHSVDGNLDTVRKIIGLGMHVSFNGILTFKNAHNINMLAQKIDISNILLETDSPFLSPTPLRGTQNYPGNVSYVYEYLSNLKQIPLEEIKEILRKNAIDVFGEYF